MSVDVRTRVDGRVEQVDAAAFFDEELPAALAGTRGLITDAVRRLSPRRWSWTSTGTCGRCPPTTAPCPCTGER